MNKETQIETLAVRERPERIFGEFSISVEVIDRKALRRASWKKAKAEGYTWRCWAGDRHQSCDPIAWDLQNVLDSGAGIEAGLEITDVNYSTWNDGMLTRAAP